MIVDATIFSALYGGSNFAVSTAFDDAANDLNPQRSISKLEFSYGWVLDSMRVTYNTVEGLERMVSHGRFTASDVRDSFVIIGDNEYVSRVKGVSGRPNGEQDYSDCIQKIQFTIKNSKTGQERVTQIRTAYFGAAQNLKPSDAKEFNWEGHLFAFAGRADNNSAQVGLKGPSFGQLSSRVTMAVSAPYAGTNRAPGLMGQSYDDLAAFGALLDFKCPIKQIDVWSGQLIDGMEVTYNLADKSTKIVMHGAKGGFKSEVKLSDTDRIVEVVGVHGVTSVQKDWGDQVQNLSFNIHNSVTGYTRTTATFGLGQEYHLETRKDICVKGLLVAFAGTGNNNLSQVGFNTVKMYTQVST